MTPGKSSDHKILKAIAKLTLHCILVSVVAVCVILWAMTIVPFDDPYLSDADYGILIARQDLMMTLAQSGALFFYGVGVYLHIVRPYLRRKGEN